MSTDKTRAEVWADMVETMAPGAAAELRRLSASEAALLDGLCNLRRAYVRLMENGRDRIRMLGGECDPVDQMEELDPNMIEASDLIARTREAMK